MNNQGRNSGGILVAGKNCWKLEQAEKLAFLIDASDYFYAFRESAKLARKNIYICGWDIDSRTDLLREEKNDGYPRQLGAFLNALAAERADLQIYILIWDFVRVLDIEREWFPQFKLGWKSHRNIHFHLDNFYPVGASIHHKLVVIDEAVSFVGGLDLTKKRWDTSRHNPESERRKTPEGEWYRPHHDIQVMVSGNPARSLGSYFRERWQLITGQQLAGTEDFAADFSWPRSIDPDLKLCRVGIARTQARYEDLPGIYEAEQLYLDSIDRARKYIYIENQYFTASKIIEALRRSLRQEHGPEVIIVLPYSTDGWLSQYTMDTLRARAVNTLRESDVNKRLAIYYAHLDGLEGDDTIKIHSKLMIMDDMFVRVGSSNLNNRSMGFDTECDLAAELDADSDQIGAVAHLRDRLLGEHLGVTAQEIRKTINRETSLLRAIEKLRGNRRSLERLEPRVTETVAIIAEEQELFDPERPIEPDLFAKLWSPVKEIAKGRFRYIQLGLAFFVLVGLAVAWRYSPLHEFITLEKLKELADVLSSSELSRVSVLGGYVVGSLLVMPITVLITLTILVFGTHEGVVLAILGSVLSGAVTYWCGRLLGRDMVRSLAGNRITMLSRKLGQNGIVSTLLIRLMPVAPFSVVNIIAGATHIRFIDFIVGTFLGMLPGIFAIAGIVDRGSALLTNPDTMTILSSIGLIVVILVGLLLIRKKFSQT